MTEESFHEHTADINHRDIYRMESATTCLG